MDTVVELNVEERQKRRASKGTPAGRSGAEARQPPAPSAGLPPLLTRPRHVQAQIALWLRDLRAGVVDAGTANAAANLLRLAQDSSIKAEAWRKLERVETAVGKASHIARAAS